MRANGVGSIKNLLTKRHHGVCTYSTKKIGLETRIDGNTTIIYNGEFPPAFALVYSYAIQQLLQKRNIQMHK